MKDTIQTVSVPPRIGAFLTQVTETTDLETALLKVLTEYISLKIQVCKQRSQTFESKWHMTFAEFSRQIKAQTLDSDPYGYEVEGDFWEWEQAETLLNHYQTLQSQWT